MTFIWRHYHKKIWRYQSINKIENYIYKITFRPPRAQWVNGVKEISDLFKIWLSRNYPSHALKLLCAIITGSPNDMVCNNLQCDNGSLNITSAEKRFIFRKVILGSGAIWINDSGIYICECQGLMLPLVTSYRNQSHGKWRKLVLKYSVIAPHLLLS